MASAMIERAELPVQRNKTLKGWAIATPATSELSAIIQAPSRAGAQV
jgi:hypothetical protein